MEKSNRLASAAGCYRRKASQSNQASKVSRVLMVMCMVLATLTVTLTATQETALAVDEGDWVTVKCTEKDGVYWKMTTKDEERVHKAIADCTTAGGVAVVSGS